MIEAELEAHYLRYISCLNDRRLEGLDEFVHEELTYNGEPETRADYRASLERRRDPRPLLRRSTARRRRRPGRVSAIL